MKIAILALTRGGRQLARQLAAGLDGARHLEISENIAITVRAGWSRFDAFIFIMAAGIVVRTIAPLIKDKRSDPCVVIVDEKGRFAISLLSGHLGGGNELAGKVAAITGGQVVLTTASDTLGLTAIDLWARDNGLVAENKTTITAISSLLVNQGNVKIFTDMALGDLPADLLPVDDYLKAEVIVSARTRWDREGLLVLRPRTLAVGIGCNRGTHREQIETAVLEVLAANHLSFISIKRLASIDLKADELGLLEFAETNELPIVFYPKDELNTVEGLQRSAAVFKATGAYGVSEPAAILAAGGGKLIVNKIKYKDVTIAIAEENA